MIERFTSDIEPLHLPEYDDSLFEIQIMTVQQVAEYLQFSEKTIYRMAQKGRIPAKRVGRSYRFYRPEIIRWLTTGGNKHGKRI